MERRWDKHVSQAKYSKGGRWHFPNAIRKYGKDAFEHYILKENIKTLEEANDFEKDKIKEFDTRNPEKGFNLAFGGNSQPHPIRKNPWDNPEYREKQIARMKIMFNDPKIRAASRAALNTPESKAKRSISSKLSHSRPEVKAKISSASKGKLNSKAKETILNRLNRLSPEERSIQASCAAKSKSREIINKTRLKNINYQIKRREELLSKPIIKVCKKHGFLEKDQIYIGKTSIGGFRIKCICCIREIRIKYRNK